MTFHSDGRGCALWRFRCPPAKRGDSGRSSETHVSNHQWTSPSVHAACAEPHIPIAQSAPGARLAVTVGPGQSQTVAVGARSAQPVAVKGYKNAYLRLRSTYRWLVYGYSRLEFKESPVRELSDRWCQANRRSQSKQGSTPQRCMGKSKFRSGTVSSAAASNGSGRRGKTANGNGRPAPVYRPPGAECAPCTACGGYPYAGIISYEVSPCTANANRVCAQQPSPPPPPPPSARLLGNPQSFKGMKSTPVRTPATTTHDVPTGVFPCDELDNIHSHVIVPDNKSPLETAVR